MKTFALRVLLYGAPGVLLLAQTIQTTPILGAGTATAFAALANLIVWKVEERNPLPVRRR